MDVLDVSTKEGKKTATKEERKQLTKFEKGAFVECELLIFYFIFCTSATS